MPYSIQHYTGGGWVNINNYILTAVKYPAIDRERNYEPRATGISFNVTWNYPNALNNGDNLKIEDPSSNVVYSGYISKSSADYDNRVYKIQIESDLVRLQSPLIVSDLWQYIMPNICDFDTYGVSFGLDGDNDIITVSGAGHGLTDNTIVVFDEDANEVRANMPYWVETIDPNRFQVRESWSGNALTLSYSGTAKYIELDNMDNTVFDTGHRYDAASSFAIDDMFAVCIYLIEAMFTHCGLTIDISSVETDNIGSLYKRGAPGGSYQSTDVNEVWINTYTLEYLNNTWGSTPISNRATYWDFIKPFFGTLGITIHQTDYKTYELIRGLSENATHNNNDYTQYSENKLNAKHGNAKMVRTFAGTEFDNYDYGTGQITFPSNFMLLFSPTEFWSTGGQYTANIPNSAIWFTDLDSLGNRPFLDLRWRPLIFSCIEKVYKINRYTTQKAFVRNMVNISITEPVSEIVEEVY